MEFATYQTNSFTGGTLSTCLSGVSKAHLIRSLHGPQCSSKTGPPIKMQRRVFFSQIFFALQNCRLFLVPKKNQFENYLADKLSRAFGLA